MKILIIIGMLIAVSACQKDKVYVPRPHQYPRMELPQRELVSFDEPDCPFVMQIPKGTSVEKKELFFENEKVEPCWFDLKFANLDATIHWSYYNITKGRTFEKLVNDAFTMASKHNVKASFREEFVLKNKYGSGGLLFKINGPVATPYQFFITDSTAHFLRGSLYFDKKIDHDSVAPIITYLEKDIDQMLSTVQWD